ncbi:MAG: DNA alkylation repair protein [Elusimicrobiota bacterium]|jgi:3-methyladenine DNA glycosylase AlkD|nr:DNA alkylation repair protein [Elusimicrobiota bacterium]
MTIKAKNEILKELKQVGSPALAKHLMRFFKTGKGEYGEGDLFLGLTVPTQRAIIKKYVADLNLKDIKELLHNKAHEVRLSALMVLVEKYKQGGKKDKEQIAKLYFANTKYINNWDLVDLTAPAISGDFWFNNSKKLMFDFAKSGYLWKERIAVVSTYYFIKRGHFDEILKLAEHFLNHKHDLMHKAAGWMLREVGKMDIEVLRGFLDKHYSVMPRTMLRYSIEKMSETERKKYMNIKMESKL